MPLVLTYFVLSCVYFEHYNVIRQGLAVPFFLLSWYFILRKKFLAYVVCILIASLIHTSAILLLPCYFFLDKRIFESKYIYVAIVIFLIFFTRMDINSILVKLMGYFDYFDFVNRYLNTNLINFTESKSNLGLTKLYPALLFVFCLIFSDLKLDNRKNIIFFNAYFISIIFLLLSYSLDILFRFYAYFEISMIFSFVVLFSGFNRKSRIALHFLNMVVYLTITNNFLMIMDMVPYRLN